MKIWRDPENPARRIVYTDYNGYEYQTEVVNNRLIKLSAVDAEGHEALVRYYKNLKATSQRVPIQMQWLEGWITQNESNSHE